MHLAINLLHEQESAFKLMKFKVDGNYFNTNNKMFENKLKQIFYENQREVEKRLEQERRELIYKKHLANRIAGSFLKDFHTIRF
jgi:hypothetical protein